MDRQDIRDFIHLLDVEKTVTLDLSNKDISELPPEIGNFTNLKYLNLSYNNLRRLPDEICKLNNLQTLLLLRNEIAELPDDFHKLKNLKLLDISYNQLHVLPPGFEKLNLLNSFDASYNMLSKLPIHFMKLNRLKELHLEQNPFEFPPYSVIKRGLYATMYFLNEEKKRRSAAQINLQVLNMPEEIQTLFMQYLEAFNEMISTKDQAFNMEAHFINPEMEHKVNLEDKTTDKLFDFVQFVRENVQTQKKVGTKRPDVSLFDSHVRELKKQVNTFNNNIGKKIHEMKAIKTRMEYLSKLLGDEDETDNN